MAGPIRAWMSSETMVAARSVDGTGLVRVAHQMSSCMVIGMDAFSSNEPNAGNLEARSR
jgi:hypothetical protein